jgi:inhibitor of KinA
MELSPVSYQIAPLGDSAVLVDFGNRIDENINQEVLARTTQIKENLQDVIEVVPAYSSLVIHYDVVKWKKNLAKESLVFDYLKKVVEDLLSQPLEVAQKKTRQIRIPVCYEAEFAPDIQELASANNLSADEVISLHLSETYRVYMLGFLPGFCYLGQVNQKIAMPRKAQPHPVAPGSIGIAGKQTGIYPFASPGGWRIIGRTPLKLFDSYAHSPALLSAGDYVQFYAIDRNEFNYIQNSNIFPEGT